MDLFAEAPVTKTFRAICDAARYVWNSQMSRPKRTISRRGNATCGTPSSPEIKLCAVDTSLMPLMPKNLDRSLSHRFARDNATTSLIARPSLICTESAPSRSREERRAPFGITETHLRTDQFRSGSSESKSGSNILGFNLSPFGVPLFPESVSSRSLGSEYRAKREARCSTTTRAAIADHQVTLFLHSRESFGAVASADVSDIHARRSIGFNI